MFWFFFSNPFTHVSIINLKIKTNKSHYFLTNKTGTSSKSLIFSRAHHLPLNLKLTLSFPKIKTQNSDSPTAAAATTDCRHCIYCFSCIMQLILYLLLFLIENQNPYPMPRYACFPLSLFSEFKFVNWNQTEERQPTLWRK